MTPQDTTGGARSAPARWVLDLRRCTKSGRLVCDACHDEAHDSALQRSRCDLDGEFVTEAGATCDGCGAQVLPDEPPAVIMCHHCGTRHYAMLPCPDCRPGAARPAPPPPVGEIVGRVFVGCPGRGLHVARVLSSNGYAAHLPLHEAPHTD